jgi:hypothetical protein
VSQDANDILMGGGAPTAKFDTIGTVIAGTLIREPEPRQQKDFRTQVPETWKDGSPKMMVVAQLATDLRDPEVPDDDGTRTLYIQGKFLTEAVRAAVRAAHANGIHTGGKLTVQYTGDGEQTAEQIKARMSPPKLYAAWYEPPAASFNGVASPGQPPAASTPPPASTPPAATQQAPLRRPDSIAEDKWGRMDRSQQERVLAALGEPAY